VTARPLPPPAPPTVRHLEEKHADFLARARSLAAVVNPPDPSAASRTDSTAPPVYARVDVVRGPLGQPLLLELWLSEPSLFIAQFLPAADRFAAGRGGAGWTHTGFRERDDGLAGRIGA
jgi:hypothetical protein